MHAQRVGHTIITHESANKMANYLPIHHIGRIFNALLILVQVSKSPIKSTLFCANILITLLRLKELLIPVTFEHFKDEERDKKLLDVCLTHIDRW